ncbi:MAG: hypothetical protein VX772_03995, partial [Bacteroidota bacterium]|nr:hypothetical protein [Bacteroidota bacterium]
VQDKLTVDSVNQYIVEERSIIAKRILSWGRRLKRLLDVCEVDTISPPENIEMLKAQLQELTGDIKFRDSKTMGEVLTNALDFVKRNYEDVSMKQIIDKKF